MCTQTINNIVDGDNSGKESDSHFFSLSIHSSISSRDGTSERDRERARNTSPSPKAGAGQATQRRGAALRPRPLQRPLKSLGPKTEGERPSPPVAKRSLARWLRPCQFCKCSERASALPLLASVSRPQSLFSEAFLRNRRCQRSLPLPSPLSIAFA